MCELRERCAEISTLSENLILERGKWKQCKFLPTTRYELDLEEGVPIDEGWAQVGWDVETVCGLSVKWACSGNGGRRAIALHAGTPPTQTGPQRRCN